MAYRIAFSRNSLSHLQGFTVREQRIVRDALVEQLTYEPTVTTKNRKEMRPNLLALWELRIGNFRVYYDVEEEESIVDIRAIGVITRTTKIRTFPEEVVHRPDML